MKWFKENWLIALLIVIIGFLLINSTINANKYRREIKAKDAFIEQLMDEYIVLEENEALSMELIKIYKQKLAIYKDSLQISRIELINQDKRYAKQIEELTRIPINDLYIDLKCWLDTISFDILSNDLSIQ